VRSSATSPKATWSLVFGAGPVGLFAAKSAWLMGAGRVLVVDHLEDRLEKARTFAHAETYNFTEYDDIVCR
jgi:threonine dehydrogenase-like Zn-dependent dehydrogenase